MSKTTVACRFGSIPCFIVGQSSPPSSSPLPFATGVKWSRTSSTYGGSWTTSPLSTVSIMKSLSFLLEGVWSDPDLVDSADASQASKGPLTSLTPRDPIPQHAATELWSNVDAVVSQLFDFSALTHFDLFLQQGSLVDRALDNLIRILRQTPRLDSLQLKLRDFAKVEMKGLIEVLKIYGRTGWDDFHPFLLSTSSQPSPPHPQDEHPA